MFEERAQCGRGRAGQIRILRVTEQAILGGEQTDVLHLLDRLDTLRFAQVLCTEPEGPLVDAAKRMNIPHLAIAMRSRFDWRAIFHLYEAMRSGRFNIVHLHGARAGLLGRIAARMAGVPVIVWTMHVFQADVLDGWRRSQEPIYHLVEGLLARYFCDHVITVSNELRRRALDGQHIPAHKVTTIYSYTDLSQFKEPPDRSAIRCEIGVPLDVPLVCVVSRLCIGKGLDDVVHAAARVHAEVPDVHFLVVGDGPLRAELESLAAHLDLDGCIHFLGHRRDVAAILFASDLFVTATHWEGFGKVSVEAMAAGKPLVATRVGAIPEVVDGYRGALLVPPRNPTAVAQAVINILQDLPTWARLAWDDRDRAFGLFGGNAMVRQTTALYERLLAAQRVDRVAATACSSDGER